MIGRIFNASLLRRAPLASSSLGFAGRQISRTQLGQFKNIKPIQFKLAIFKRANSTTTAAPLFEEPQASKAVGYWLLGMGGLVFGIVVVGGLTRLTESGLSITEWNLIKGMKYPSSPTEWEVEFEKYRQSPEYHKLNHHMTVDEFKNIYFMEWFHRMWGRFIGVAFMGPLAYFWARGRLSPSLKPKLLGLGGLIGFQGALGWYMVKSGLDQQLMEDPNAVPRVSSLRLASHLGSAFVLYAGFMKIGWDVLKPKSLLPTPTHLIKFRKYAHSATGLVFVTAMTGALVAGLDAGMIYNEFPYMGESIVPALQERWSPLFAKDPKTGEGMWHNFFNNPTLVQFNHRVLAVTTFCSVMGLYGYSRGLQLARPVRIAVRLMAGVAILQVSLGIGTLIYSVPISLAAAHQSGSLMLLTSGMWLVHQLKRLPK